MWTRKHRGIYKLGGGRYPSDLTDAEWARLVPLIPPGKPGGRPRMTRHAGGDERDPISAAHRLPLALSATRRLPGGRRSGLIYTWSCVRNSGVKRAPQPPLSTVSR
jgi:hypothetical protein